MDPFYNKSVTIWNKYVDGLMQEEHWVCTVIENVRILVSKGNNIQKSGNSAADSVRLHIKDSTSKPHKPFLAKQEWDKLVLSEKEDYFTLDDEGSFFVEGDASSENPNRTGFFEYMKRNHTNCFRISNVDRFDAIPHWEVWGK